MTHWQSEQMEHSTDQTVTNNMNNRELADKPSDLLEQAMEDLEKIEKCQNYRINMRWWHIPTRDTTTETNMDNACTVCLAGAVMACSLGADPTKDIGPEYFGEPTALKLHALDSLRSGRVAEALDWLSPKICTPEIREQVENVMYGIGVTPYQDSAVEFKKDMKRIVDYLRSVGI